LEICEAKYFVPAARSICVNAGHRAPNLISVHSMDRSILYIIGVIVVIVIVLKLLHVF
jgi:hypothetical protein